jgi:hypothetical protein
MSDFRGLQPATGPRPARAPRGGHRWRFAIVLGILLGLLPGRVTVGQAPGLTPIIDPRDRNRSPCSFVFGAERSAKASAAAVIGAALSASFMPISASPCSQPAVACATSARFDGGKCAASATARCACTSAFSGSAIMAFLVDSMLASNAE